MQIKNIITGSDVKVLTVNGNVVKHFDDLDFNQNIIYWDGKSDNGNYLSSGCLLYTSPSPRDLSTSRMPSSA